MGMGGEINAFCWFQPGSISSERPKGCNNCASTIALRQLRCNNLKSTISKQRLHCTMHHVDAIFVILLNQTDYCV